MCFNDVYDKLEPQLCVYVYMYAYVCILCIELEFFKLKTQFYFELKIHFYFELKIQGTHMFFILKQKNTESCLIMIIILPSATYIHTYIHTYIIYIYIYIYTYEFTLRRSDIMHDFNHVLITLPSPIYIYIHTCIQV
jgi:hypothetical protein